MVPFYSDTLVKTPHHTMLCVKTPDFRPHCQDMDYLTEYMQCRPSVVTDPTATVDCGVTLNGGTCRFADPPELAACSLQSAA